jgi:hypothetical protein
MKTKQIAIQAERIARYFNSDYTGRQILTLSSCIVSALLYFTFFRVKSFDDLANTSNRSLYYFLLEVVKPTTRFGIECTSFVSVFIYMLIFFKATVFLIALILSHSEDKGKNDTPRRSPPFYGG